MKWYSWIEKNFDDQWKLIKYFMLSFFETMTSMFEKNHDCQKKFVLCFVIAFDKNHFSEIINNEMSMFDFEWQKIVWNV